MGGQNPLRPSVNYFKDRVIGDKLITQICPRKSAGSCMEREGASKRSENESVVSARARVTGAPSKPISIAVNPESLRGPLTAAD